MLTVIVDFKPIPIAGKPVDRTGKIISLSNAGVNDVVLTLENHTGSYYINCGFERVDANTLQQLIGKNAVITYYESWTPLDPFTKRSKSITRLKVGGSIFFEQ